MDLKQKLAELKKSLADKHDFLAESETNARGKKSTRPIDILSNFIEANEVVQNELKLAGFDWPVEKPMEESPVEKMEEKKLELIQAPTDTDNKSELNDSVLNEIVTSVVESTSPGDTAVLPPVPTVTDKEVLFTFENNFYKRNRYSSAIWKWNKFHSNWVWDYLGISGRLHDAKKEGIEAASYKALAEFVEPKIETKSENKTEDYIDLSDAPALDCHNKEDYVLFFVIENEKKTWYRIHKEWHSIWVHSVKTICGVTKDDWDWHGYPADSSYVGSKKIDIAIDNAAVEALKKYKEKNPKDTKVLLVGEKKSYYNNYGRYSGHVSTSTYTYTPHEDKEAPIDCETAIHVIDANEVIEDENADADIGKLTGKFTKKSDVGGYGSYYKSTPTVYNSNNTPSHNSNQSYDDYDYEDWYHGSTRRDKSESSKTFPAAESSEPAAQTFPTSKGTVTPTSSIRIGGPNSVSGGDDSTPLFDGYSHLKNNTPSIVPLEGYGDTIKSGDWVVVSFKYDNKEAVLEYDGQPLKVVAYYRSPNQLMVDLMHQDGTMTKTLYQGPNWKKLFKIVESPFKKLESPQDPLLDSFLIDDDESPLR